MGCLGVHFAITEKQAKRLLAARGDERRAELIEEIEEADDDELAVPTDKAWDAIHRCLSDGTLNVTGGDYPLNRCILGGRHLYRGSDYIIAYVTSEEVKDVAAALAPIDKEWLQVRYARLAGTEYAIDVSDEDFEYTWSNLEDVKAFYRKAAELGRAVIFTADQ